MPHGFELGDLVWARVAGFPAWPGQVLDKQFVKPGACKLEKPNTVLISFFGDSSYGWIDYDLLENFLTVYEARRKQVAKPKNAANFKKAVEEAKEVSDRRLRRTPATDHDPFDILRPESWQQQFWDDFLKKQPVSLPREPTPEDYKLLNSAAALKMLKSCAASPAHSEEVSVYTLDAAMRQVYSLMSRQRSKHTAKLEKQERMRAAKASCKADAVDADSAETATKQKKKRMLLDDMEAEHGPGSGRKKKRVKVDDEAEVGSADEAGTPAPRGKRRLKQQRVFTEDQLKYGAHIDVALSEIPEVVSAIGADPVRYASEVLPGPAGAFIRFREAAFRRSGLIRNGALDISSRLVLQDCGALPDPELLTPARKPFKGTDKKALVSATPKANAPRAIAPARKAQPDNNSIEDKSSGEEDADVSSADESDEARPHAPSRQPKATPGRKPGRPPKLVPDRKDKKERQEQREREREQDTSPPPADNVTTEEVKAYDYAGLVGTKDQFESLLQRFCGERGQMLQPMHVCGITLDVYKVFKLVAERSGYDMVTAQQLWRQVASEWNPELKDKHNAPALLRQAYLKHLLSFERDLCRGKAPRTVLLERRSTADPAKVRLAAKPAPGRPGSLVMPKPGAAKRQTSQPTDKEWLKQFDDLLDDNDTQGRGAAGTTATKSPTASARPAQLPAKPAASAKPTHAGDRRRVQLKFHEGTRLPTPAEVSNCMRRIHVNELDVTPIVHRYIINVDFATQEVAEAALSQLKGQAWQLLNVSRGSVEATLVSLIRGQKPGMGGAKAGPPGQGRGPGSRSGSWQPYPSQPPPPPPRKKDAPGGLPAMPQAPAVQQQLQPQFIVQPGMTNITLQHSQGMQFMQPAAMFIQQPGAAPILISPPMLQVPANVTRIGGPPMMTSQIMAPQPHPMDAGGVHGMPSYSNSMQPQHGMVMQQPMMPTMLQHPAAQPSQLPADPRAARSQAEVQQAPQPVRAAPAHPPVPAPASAPDLMALLGTGGDLASLLSGVLPAGGTAPPAQPQAQTEGTKDISSSMMSLFGQLAGAGQLQQ